MADFVLNDEEQADFLVPPWLSIIIVVFCLCLYRFILCGQPNKPFRRLFGQQWCGVQILLAGRYLLIKNMVSR